METQPNLDWSSHSKQLGRERGERRKAMETCEINLHPMQPFVVANVVNAERQWRPGQHAHIGREIIRRERGERRKAMETRSPWLR